MLYKKSRKKKDPFWVDIILVKKNEIHKKNKMKKKRIY